MADQDTISIKIIADSNKAISELRQFDKELDKLGATADKAGKAAGTSSATGFGKLNTAFKDLTGFSLGAAVGVGTLTTAVGKGVEFVKSAVEETQAYAREVLLLSQNLGLTAEETSRLIQVSDDYGISTDQLRTALQLAAKNGFAPSIENIAKLADQTNAITDPTQRAAELTKIFGRNWATLTPLLKAGGNAIRDAAGEVSDSLIVTDEAIAKSEKYRLALDSFNDALAGIKYTVGNIAMEELADGIGEVADVISDPAFGEFLKWMNYARKIAAGDFAEVLVDIAKDKLPAFIEAAERGAEAQKNLGDISHYTAASLDLSAEAAAESAEANDLLNQRLSDLKDLMAGDLGDEMERFGDANLELRDKAEQLRAKIDELEKQEYLTSEQAEELLGLRGELDEVNTSLEENAAKHEETTKRILFSMLEQRLAQNELKTATGEFTASEITLLETVATKWGLVDETTATSLRGMEEVMIAFANGAGPAEIMAMLEKLRISAQIKGSISFPDVKMPKIGGGTVTIQGGQFTEEEDNGPVIQGGQIEQEQFGGHVQPLRSYLVGEAGPEVAVFGQSGQIVSHNQAVQALQGPAGPATSEELAALISRQTTLIASLPGAIARAVRDGVLMTKG